MSQFSPTTTTPTGVPVSVSLDAASAAGASAATAALSASLAALQASAAASAASAAQSAAASVGKPEILELAASSDLADVDISSISNNAKVGVSLPGDVLQWWKLRLLALGEIDVEDGIVTSAADATRCWVRIG